MTGLTFPHAPGFKGDLDTGRYAARSFAPKAETIRAQTLEILKRGPATAQQVAEITGDHWMVVRARCSELRAPGLVDDSGLRGKGALGSKVVVWRPTTALERAAIDAAKAEGV